MNHFTTDTATATLLISFDPSLKVVTAVEEIKDEFKLSRSVISLKERYRHDQEFRAQCDKELAEYLILLEDDNTADYELADSSVLEELYADDSYTENIS